MDAASGAQRTLLLSGTVVREVADGLHRSASQPGRFAP